MKKYLYISLFVILGLELQFLIYTVIEANYLYLLTKDFESYCLGYSWQELHGIRYVFSSAFVVLGTLFGLQQGIFWWKYIYVDKKIEKRWRNKKSWIWRIIKY